MLYSSWGYEQTNIDYYLVTKLVGKTSVELVKIGRHAQYDSRYMGGECTPDISIIESEPFRKQASGDRVKINSYASARKVDYTVADGVRVYQKAQFTNYA